MFESLLQVVVYGIVGDLAQQGEICYTDFLLLGDLEGGFLDLWLAIASVLLPTSEQRGFSGALALTSFGLALFRVSSCLRRRWGFDLTIAYRSAMSMYTRAKNDWNEYEKALASKEPRNRISGSKNALIVVSGRASTDCGSTGRR